MKKILIVSVFIVAILGLGLLIKTQKAAAPLVVQDNPVVVDTQVKQPIQLCFLQKTKTTNGLYNIAWLKMNLMNEKVDGEFNYIPAEKDKKVGAFEGIVGPVNKITMSRTADVWWSSLAEGMQNKEQLRINFGEGNAYAGFGEMVDHGDGTYVYKDISKIVYGPLMTDVDCSNLSELVKVPPPVSTTEKFSTEYSLKIGEHITLPDGLTVTLKKVNDSRCPKDVTCVWAGELSPVLSATGGYFYDKTQEVIIGTVRNQSNTVGGYTFAIRSATDKSANIVVYRGISS
ncbi:MAG: hypothetical protein NTZ44_02310 [Candidatus Nomurabacteria bacterium]|nr:hypothetical protein [Candidatus Nomurabacteria bacterium]